MKNKLTLTLICLALFNVFLLILIKPLIAAFYAMDLSWKLLYILFLYGFPVLIVIPLMLLGLLFSFIPSKKRKFTERFFRITRFLFLTISIIIVLINSGIVFSKYYLGKKIFQHALYSEIKGTNENTGDLKMGRFKSKYAYIVRYKSTQAETYTNGKILIYHIDWLAENEYRLINISGSNGMNDTILVRITSNKSDSYECYVKYGDYAERSVVGKLKQ